MLDDFDSIPVRCPHCRKKSDQEIGWLKAHAHFKCACGRVIQCDYNKLMEFLRDQAAYPLTAFELDPIG